MTKPVPRFYLARLDDGRLVVCDRRLPSDKYVGHGAIVAEIFDFATGEGIAAWLNANVQP